MALVHDEDLNIAKVDGNSKSLIISTITHDRLHEGRLFHAYDYGEVVSTESKYWLIDTNGIEEVHILNILFEVEGTPDDVFMYESPTVSNNGTLLTAHNKNRNSSNSATVDVYTGPTISSNGTEIDRDILTTAGKNRGLTISRDVDWILKPNTQYLIRFTNNSGGNEDLLMRTTWYERL